MKRQIYLCLLGLLLAIGSASAAPYSFTNIIDSSVAASNGNYLSFGETAISGDKVAFTAAFRRGGGITDSVLTSRGGPRTEVAFELMTVPSGTVDRIGRPSLDSQNVYFDARVYLGLADFGDGLFYGYGQRHVNGSLLLTTVVSPRLVPVNAPKIVADPLISQGFLAYLGSANTIGVINPERTFTRIVSAGDAAPPGGTFSAIDANYGLSGGTAAFRGLYGNQEGIFSGAGGSLTTIAKKGDPTPSGETLNSVLDPTISGGTVAFLGAFAGGSGIFTGNGGALSSVVKTGDSSPGGNPFSAFSAPAIAFNMLAFRGEHAGGSGIYTKRGDELSKVVEIGDSLFGSTVASLTFSDLGLDRGGSGNLAFNYGLANGRTGVAMAVPGAGLPTIYQRNGLPVLDSVGIVWVPTPNFEGRNLTNANLSSADLRTVNARNVNFTDASLKHADLTNADLRDANLSRAIVEAAVLTGANLNGANVFGASFDRLYSTTTPICTSGGCSNFNVVGSGTGITPAQLSGTTNYQAHDLAGISLEGNNLTNANLVGQNLTGANFTYATLTGANLTDAEIRGANFGRYWLSTEAQCVNFGTCTLTTGIIGSGVTAEQLYTTASYKAHDLTGIGLGGNNLAGVNFTGQNLSRTYFSGDLLHNSPAANLANANLSHANLTNAVFSGATLTSADLSGADARGALGLGSFGSPNLIRPDGHVTGLDLAAGQMLSVRDYDGNPTGTIPITVDQHFAIGSGGTLKMVFESDDWNSTISFGAGIPVTLGGEMELAFAAGVNPITQLGRTFDLFDWTGVNPTGTFTVVSDYPWDTSQLYTTGEVTLIPEPASLALLLAAAILALAARRASRPSNI